MCSMRLCVLGPIVGAALLTSGCLPVRPNVDYRPLAAAVMAVHAAAQPESAIDPAPTPQPLPETACANCGGTGKLGDGRVVVICPVCAGSGKAKAPATTELKTNPAIPSKAPQVEMPQVNTPRAAQLPKVLCLVFICESCPPCSVLVADLQQRLPPVGWQVGETASAMIRLVRHENDPGGLTQRYAIRRWPSALFVVDGQTQPGVNGRLTANTIAQRMVEL